MPPFIFFYYSFSFFFGYLLLCQNSEKIITKYVKWYDNGRQLQSVPSNLLPTQYSLPCDYAIVASATAGISAGLVSTWGIHKEQRCETGIFGMAEVPKSHYPQYCGKNRHIFIVYQVICASVEVLHQLMQKNMNNPLWPYQSLVFSPSEFYRWCWNYLQHVKCSQNIFNWSFTG